MSKNDPKAMARGLLGRYKAQRPTLDDIAAMITDRGYEILDFDPDTEADSTMLLAERLGLTAALQGSPALAYRNSDIKLVFVDASLGAAEKCYALAHELGHIVCGHLRSGAASTGGVLAEVEANEFAHYLFQPGAAVSALIWVKRHLVVTVIVLIAVLGIAVGVPVGMEVSARQAYERTLYESGQYFVTDGGTRYHREDCVTLQGSTSVHPMTTEEFESGQYEPCRICMP